MVDRYTKCVLTIIAGCLVWNIISGTNVQQALAQSGPVRVVVDSIGMYAFHYVTPIRVTQ